MKNIKRLRKALGLTQAEFAKSISVSRTTVTMWETGHHEPDYTLLSQIAEKYDVPTDFLIGCGLYSNWDEIMENREKILQSIAVGWPSFKSILSASNDELFLIRFLGAFCKRIIVDGDDLHLFPTIPLEMDKEFPSESPINVN